MTTPRLTRDDLERIAQLAEKVAKIREHYVHRQDYLVERREAEADFARDVSPEVVGELIRLATVALEMEAYYEKARIAQHLSDIESEEPRS